MWVKTEGQEGEQKGRREKETEKLRDKDRKDMGQDKR